MLNPELLNDDVLSKLRETYKSSDNVITIPDLLDKEHASKLETHIRNLPSQEWGVSIHPYRSDILTFNNIPMNSGAIKEGKQKAHESMKNGGFSYFFYRHDGHKTDCTCLLCSTIALFKTEPFFKMIKAITDEDVSSTISVFSSIYRAGCFLSTHTDTGRGKLAFVFNITKDWNVENGGLFQLLKWDYQSVTKTVVPTFNTLTVFRVVGNGIPHRVTCVVDETTNERVAVSGWLI